MNPPKVGAVSISAPTSRPTNVDARQLSVHVRKAFTLLRLGGTVYHSVASSSGIFLELNATILLGIETSTSVPVPQRFVLSLSHAESC